MKNCVEVYAFESYGHGKLKAYKIQITETDSLDGELVDPAMEIPRKQSDAILSALKKALIDYGVMRSGEGLEGELKATKAHLDDMKNIAEKALDLATRQPPMLGPELPNLDRY